MLQYWCLCPLCSTESLQEYMHNIDASSDEEEPDEDVITSQMQHANMESPSEEQCESSRKVWLPI